MTRPVSDLALQTSRAFLHTYYPAGGSPTNAVVEKNYYYYKKWSYAVR